MNESVIFVKSIRERDSDIYVIEDDDDLLSENNTVSSGRNRKINSKPVAYIDLSQETSESVSKDSQIPTGKQNYTISNNNVPFECSVCLNLLQSLNIKSLQCGHAYCTDCINMIMQNRKVKCPKCRKITLNKDIRPVFL